MIKCILPCAGFGTRVNTPLDKSKELNHYNGKPLIEYSLDICKKYNLTPHIITRKEKIDLIAYCEAKNITVQILDKPGKEWAHTVLLSNNYWTENNILMFPDSIWKDEGQIEDMILNLQMGNPLALGVFNVEDQSLWSVINNYCICEKPNIKGPGIAWGIVGFKKITGQYFFEVLKIKGIYSELETVSFHLVNGFEDVTRKTMVGI